MFAAEQPRLLPLPANPFPTEERVAVKAGKTPYVRFDRNDYSIPHDRVQRTLTVLATPTAERIVEGATVLATHPRSYDQGAQIEALLHGHTMRFTTAGALLVDLAALDSDSLLRRRLRDYAAPQLMVIDEAGYLSYSPRHADLLFELVSRRYDQKSTLITTNRPFAEWGEVFPGAACVVSLIDRLLHHAEIIAIAGESYRLKEAQERAAQRASQRWRATT